MAVQVFGTMYTTDTNVEVTHWKHGRGRIEDVSIGQQGHVDDADVYFYTSDSTLNVPLTTLSPASKVASVETKEGQHGLEIVIDDGFFELIVTANGHGTGFDVAMKAGAAEVDTCQLSYEAFL